MKIIGDIFIVILALAIIYCYIFGWVRIFNKAGYHGAMGLLMLIPVANIIGFIILAFKEWPIYREGKVIEKLTKNN